MSVQRLTIDGYGQLELNQVAFRRDGRIEAQSKIAAGIDFVENGMLLAIDHSKREVKLPTPAADDVIALNYTTEHMYDEREQALKNFKLDKDTFLPRLGYLAEGDKFTTNTVCFDDAEFAAEPETKTAEDVFKEKIAANAQTYYGVPDATGAIKVTATKGTPAVALKVVKATTMPDGQWAIQFVCVK